VVQEMLRQALWKKCSIRHLLAQANDIVDITNVNLRLNFSGLIPRPLGRFRLVDLGVDARNLTGG